MPTYKFLDKNSKKEWEEFMSISERTKYLEDNPHIEQLVNGAPLIADPMRIGGTSVSKPDNGFRDVLKQVKKMHPLGTGINTW